MDALKPEYELKVAAQTGRYEEMGWRVRKDGSMFWANVVITAQRDAAGGVTGFAKVMRDMTTHKQAEEALRRSEERYRLLLDSVKDHAIFMLDPSGRVTSWNAGARRLKGYEAEEIVGEHFSVFYMEEDRERGHPAWELEKAMREGRYEEEGWRIRKDGSRFWANVVITRILAADGAPLGFAKVTRDLTERREHEARLARSHARTRRVEDENQELEAFSYTVAHDLRAPLRAVLQTGDVLLEDHAPALNGDGRALLGAMLRSARHMAQLVDDLLHLSRAAGGDLSPAEVDLAAMAEDVLGGLRRREPHRAVQTRVQPAMKVRADPRLLRVAVDNLLSNAWKFTRGTPDARIDVELERRFSEDIVHVRDNGAGFDPARAGRLFQPFHRLHDPGEFEGTGVGLATVRRIVERHGGRVGAHGEPGKGAAFFLALPRDDPPGAGDARRGGAARGPRA